MKKCNNCGERATLITDVSDAIINLTSILGEVERLRNIESEKLNLEYELRAMKDALRHLGLTAEVQKYIDEDYIPF